MKRNVILGAIFILFPAVIFINGCKKDHDTTPPSISLTGGTTIYQSLPTVAGAGTWNEPGYSATDDKDGSSTGSVSVSGSVNPNKKGTYILTYTLTDNAGNGANIQRTVYIVNDADVFAGEYATSTDTVSSNPSIGGPLTPFPAVTPSDSVNTLVTISNFGGYGADVKVIAYLTTGSITIPVVPVQYLDASHKITLDQIFIDKTVIVSATAPTKFDVKYQITDGRPVTDTCITHYTR